MRLSNSIAWLLGWFWQAKILAKKSFSNWKYFVARNNLPLSPCQRTAHKGNTTLKIDHYDSSSSTHLMQCGRVVKKRGSVAPNKCKNIFSEWNVWRVIFVHLESAIIMPKFENLLFNNGRMIKRRLKSSTAAKWREAFLKHCQRVSYSNPNSIFPSLFHAFPERTANPFSDDIYHWFTIWIIIKRQDITELFLDSLEIHNV